MLATPTNIFSFIYSLKALKPCPPLHLATQGEDLIPSKMFGGRTQQSCCLIVLACKNGILKLLYLKIQFRRHSSGIKAAGSPSKDITKQKGRVKKYLSFYEFDWFCTTFPNMAFPNGSWELKFGESAQYSLALVPRVSGEEGMTAKPLYSCLISTLANQGCQYYFYATVVVNATYSSPSNKTFQSNNDLCKGSKV